MATFPVVQGVEVFMAPPEGYVVDFENPQQHTALVSYILAGVGMAIAMIFFIQYLYVKLWLMRVLELETVLLIVAWVTGVVQSGVLLASWAIKTLGVHAWEMSLDQYNLFNKLMLIASIHFAVFIACSKLSLVLFYRRLSPQRWWKWCTYAVAVLIICYNTAILFAIVFTCNPIRKHWDARVTEGSCGHQIGIYMTTATMGILTDLMLLIMPIPMIWGLQMPTRQKIGVILLFCIGFGTLLTSVIRLALYIPALYATDSTWELAPSQVLVVPEASLLTICPCLTTLRRFFAHVAPKVIGLRGSSARFTRSHTTAITGQNPYRTVGSNAGKRRKVDEFGLTVDEEVFHMENVRQVVPNKVVIEACVDDRSSRESPTGEGASSAENLTWDPRLGGDDFEPERGIVQTRTVTVVREI